MEVIFFNFKFMIPLSRLLRSALCFMGLLVFVLTAATSSAFGLANPKIERTVNPGESYDESVNVIPNTQDSNIVYTLSFRDVIFHENDAKTYLEEGESTPDGIATWIEGEKTITVPNDGSSNSVSIPFKVNVPQDAEPGTHKVAMILSEGEKDNALEGSSVTLKQRVIGFTLYTVTGDVQTGLELESFSLNEKDFEKGVLSFDVKVKNTGNVSVAPRGKVEFYANGELIERIVENTTENNGETIITGYSNHLTVNEGGGSVFPEKSKSFKVFADNLTLNPGKYKAELNLFFQGPLEKSEQQELKSELEVEIEKGLYIESLEGPGFSMGLPVIFNSKVKNNTQSTIDVEGSLAIYDLFGRIVDEIPVTKTSILSGQSLPLQNLEWSEGSPFGLYTAVISLDQVGTNIKATESMKTLVLSLWQIVVVVLVAVIILFLIIKMTKNYLALKKKVENSDKKSE